MVATNTRSPSPVGNCTSPRFPRDGCVSGDEEAILSDEDADPGNSNHNGSILEDWRCYSCKAFRTDCGRSKTKKRLCGERALVDNDDTSPRSNGNSAIC